MRQREQEDRDVAEDAGHGDAQLRKEEIDAVAIYPWLPEFKPGRALEGSRENAGYVPGS